MSRSARCKTKAATRSHDITSGRVVEMIELAAALTNRPDAAETRAALLRIANELLTNRSDATIEQAIEAAPSCRIAQTLQQAVEDASERVVIYRDGVRAELSLFAIPIITTFEENVPESQFESALDQLGGLKGLATKLKDGRLSPMTLLPKLFRLDDLNMMPWSLVREVGINFGAGAMNGRSECHLSMTPTWSFKRSTSFLRFLVGQRLRFEHEDWIADEGGVCERLHNLTSVAVKRYLGLSCRVRAFYTGSFYEAVYAGMWVYQETRLDQLARTTCAQTRRNKALEARIVAYGGRHRFEMWLGFFAGNQAVGAHAYRLRSRPSEDRGGCMSRIASRLEAAGIKTNALRSVLPEERRWGRQTGRKIDPSMVTVSI